METAWRILALTAVAVVVAAPAAAQEKTDPEEITTGVVRLTLNKPYASVKVDGEEWEQSFFEEDGAVLVLEGGLVRKTPHTLHLVPMEEEFRFEDLTIDPKDWKLARIDKQTRQWQFLKKIEFRPWKPGEREEWEKTRVPEKEDGEEAEEAEEPAAKPEKVIEPSAPETAPMTGPAPEEEPAAEPAPAETPAAPSAPEEEPAPSPAEEIDA